MPNNIKNSITSSMGNVYQTQLGLVRLTLEVQVELVTPNEVNGLATSLLPVENFSSFLCKIDPHA